MLYDTLVRLLKLYWAKETTPEVVEAAFTSATALALADGWSYKDLDVLSEQVRDNKV